MGILVAKMQNEYKGKVVPLHKVWGENLSPPQPTKTGVVPHGGLFIS
jgi:hypothetical protein